MTGANAGFAIKATLDATLVRQNHSLNERMVLLTIAISGGPFLGLLGTVVGVMITFAAIAAAGDVNVNAIAPGIAAALLATVAGLGVAIPALFGYNWLASKHQEHLGRHADLRRRVRDPRGRSCTAIPERRHDMSADIRAENAALRRHQHHAHAGSGVCVAGHLHHPDHRLGAGGEGEVAAAPRPPIRWRKPQTRAITITSDGAVYLDAYPVTLDELASKDLATFKAGNPALPVVLKADARTAVPEGDRGAGGGEEAGHHRNRPGDAARGALNARLRTHRNRQGEHAPCPSKVGNDTKPYDTINVTPMLDLAYVLLVVFHLDDHRFGAGLTINMPKPSNKPPTERHELLIVQVAADGALLLNGANLSIDEIEARLTSARARDPKLTVAIKGPRQRGLRACGAGQSTCATAWAIDMGLVTSRIGT